MMEPDDDVDAWIERLAGRGTGASDRTTDALRASIRARGERADQQVLARLDADDGAQEHALQRLRFRLKREKLAGGSSVLRPQVWIPTAAAAMLALVIGIDATRSPPGGAGYDIVHEEAPRFRGGGDVEVRATDAEGSAKALAGALAAAGVRSTVYLHAGSATLVFELTTEQIDTARSILSAQAPQAILAAGVNRVVIRSD